MNILNYLKIGMAIFLSLNTPVVEYQPEFLIIHTKLSNILTDDMITLLNSGMDFSFQIYSSLRSKDDILINRFTKKLSFDRINNKFIINDGTEKTFTTLHDALNNLKSFNFKYTLNDKSEINYSFFCEISILPDQFMESNLNIKTMELWSNYKPSIKYDFKYGDK